MISMKLISIIILLNTATSCPTIDTFILQLKAISIGPIFCLDNGNFKFEPNGAIIVQPNDGSIWIDPNDHAYYFAEYTGDCSTDDVCRSDATTPPDLFTSPSADCIDEEAFSLMLITHCPDLTKYNSTTYYCLDGPLSGLKNIFINGPYYTSIGGFCPKQPECINEKVFQSKLARDCSSYKKLSSETYECFDGKIYDDVSIIGPIYRPLGGFCNETNIEVPASTRAPNNGHPLFDMLYVNSTMIPANQSCFLLKKFESYMKHINLKWDGGIDPGFEIIPPEYDVVFKDIDYVDGNFENDIVSVEFHKGLFRPDFATIKWKVTDCRYSISPKHMINYEIEYENSATNVDPFCLFFILVTSILI